MSKWAVTEGVLEAVLKMAKASLVEIAKSQSPILDEDGKPTDKLHPPHEGLRNKAVVAAVASNGGAIQAAATKDLLAVFNGK